MEGEKILVEKIKKDIIKYGLLIESNSVSPTVTEYAKNCIVELVDKAKKCKGFYVPFSMHDNDYWRILKKDGVIITKPNKDFYSSLCIILSVYEFDNIECVKKCHEVLHFGGEYNPDSGQIAITTYSIKGKINIEFAEWYLQHELMHIFQDNKANKHEQKKLYYIATNVLFGNGKYNNNDIVLSSLIYFLNKKEINANAQTLYAQIGDVEKYQATNVYQDFLLVRSYFEDFSKDKSFLAKCSVIEYKKLEYDKTLLFFQNYINYALGKFSHVIQQKHNEKIIKEYKVKPIRIRISDLRDNFSFY